MSALNTQIPTNLSTGQVIVNHILDTDFGARRRQAVDEVQKAFGLLQRRVCQAIEQPRSNQRYIQHIPNRDEPLTKRIVDLAIRYGRYGYRRITAGLRAGKWWVNHKQVERIWRRGGLKAPRKRPERG